MNVLVLSLDSALLEPQPAMGDTLRRHVGYVKTLREMCTSGSLDILVRGVAGKEFPPLGATGLQLHPVGSSAPAFLLNAGRVGRRLLAEKEFDLITTQTPFLDGVAGVLLKKRTGTPLLIQLHSSFLDNPRWLAESRTNRLRRLVGLWALRHADAIRVVSSQAAKWCRLKFPGSRVHLVPVAVTLDLPTTYVRPTSPTVLFAGRFVWQKNVALLLHAFARVHAALPQASLVLVGDGPERSGLEQLAGQLLPTGTVTFTGAVPYREMGHYYQQAMVLAVPSRYEPYGRVILEGLAYGRPVVATETEGATMLVQEGFGCIVTQENAESLAKELLLLLQNPAKAAEMGRRGWAWVRETYAPEALQAEWVRVWVQAAGRGADCVS